MKGAEEGRSRNNKRQWGTQSSGKNKNHLESNIFGNKNFFLKSTRNEWWKFIHWCEHKKGMEWKIKAQTIL